MDRQQALSAGLTGLEMGSDIAGSIRNPAAHCGLFGHKPTMGICSTLGHTLANNLAPIDMLVIGPLARSADDLAISLSAIVGLDEIDTTGLKVSLSPARKKQLKEYRVSILVDDNTVPLARDIVALQQELADFLKSSKVELEIGERPSFDVEEAHRIYDIMLRATTSARQTDEEFDANVAAREALDPEDDSKWARMLRGMTLSHRDWTVLNEARHQIRWKWHEYFQTYDLMLTPATMMTAIPPHGDATIRTLRRDRWYSKAIHEPDLATWIFQFHLSPHYGSSDRICSDRPARRRPDHRSAIRRSHLYSLCRSA